MALYTQITNLASSVTYYFSANLSEAIGTIPAGTSFTGFFSYDFPQALNVGSNEDLPPTTGNYVPLNFGITIGSESVLFSNPNNYKYIHLYNKTERTFLNGEWRGGWQTDTFHTYLQGAGQYLGGREVTDLAIYLDDSGGTIFPNLELVGDTMRWADFDYGYVGIRYKGGSEVRSTPTSLVPEPSSLSLLVAGGAVLMAGRRRNRETISPKG